MRPAQLSKQDGKHLFLVGANVVKVPYCFTIACYFAYFVLMDIVTTHLHHNFEFQRCNAYLVGLFVRIMDELSFWCPIGT